MLFGCTVCRFFFFQAEDGIRDGHVTGVQTCALPISAHHLSRFARPSGVWAAAVWQTPAPGVPPVSCRTVSRYNVAIVPNIIYCPKFVARMQIHVVRSEERRVGKECRSRRW